MELAATFMDRGGGNYQYIFNGIITTVQCEPSTKIEFKLGISTTGKIINAETQAGFEWPGKCVKTIHDTRNNTVLKCEAGEKNCTQLPI